MKSLIRAKELKELSDVQLVDARFSMNDETLGQAEYDKEHVLNARYLNMDLDLAGEVTKDTGNHPLPSKEDFEKTLEQLGFVLEKPVVIYDFGDLISASRAWFVFRYFGFDKVFVVAGGYPALKAEGIETTKEKQTWTPSQLSLNENKDLVASYEEILAFSKEPHGLTLIDSRAKARYEGHQEPLYEVAGHIPGAVNFPFEEVYGEGGQFKKEEALKDHFSSLKKADDIVVSCGSGVTACVNALALDQIGLPSRVYVGSYSQWIKKGNKVHGQSDS